MLIPHGLVVPPTVKARKQRYVIDMPFISCSRKGTIWESINPRHILINGIRIQVILEGFKLSFTDGPPMVEKPSRCYHVRRVPSNKHWLDFLPYPRIGRHFDFETRMLLLEQASSFMDPFNAIASFKCSHCKDYLFLFF